MKKIPALLTKISNRDKLSFIFFAKLLTVSKSDRSKYSTSMFSFPVNFIISLAACSAFLLSLHANITRAPRLAKSKAVSKPIPVFEPVMIVILPSNLFSDLQVPPLK